MERVFEACSENLNQVIEFLDEHLDEWNCSMKSRIHLEIAAEELFVNIANYAYSGQDAKTPRTVVVQMQLLSDHMAEIIFKDQGKPYDPLKRPDPDITKNAEEREIGGLGVFLVKKMMNDVQYRYEDGWNILTIRKDLKNSEK